MVQFVKRHYAGEQKIQTASDLGTSQNTKRKDLHLVFLLTYGFGLVEFQGDSINLKALRAS